MRLVLLGLLLLPVVLSIGIRIPTFLAARKIHAVLSGLEQLRIDETTEEQLLKTVPYIILSKPTDPALPGGRKYYRVDISNATSYFGWTRWLPDFLSIEQRQVEFPIGNKWSTLNWALKVAYVLGWRHLSFSASVTVLNGRVSGTWYGFEPDVPISIPTSYFVVARSAHGFSMGNARLLPVDSTDDEKPEFLFGVVAGQFSLLEGADSSIGVAYTADAPRDLVSHAFQVDLTCYWSIHGCDSVRQVVPLLWQDRHEIEGATQRRLSSGNPCPDRILAGRVRYLSDLNIALLEVVNSREEEINREGERTEDIITDYQLKEVIRGHPAEPWSDIRRRWTIPWPYSPNGRMPNPEQPYDPKPGDRYLYFSGADFDSCRIVPATSSAEAAVRTAIPAPRRVEDEIGWMWGRR